MIDMPYAKVLPFAPETKGPGTGIRQRREAILPETGQIQAPLGGANLISLGICRHSFGHLHGAWRRKASSGRARFGAPKMAPESVEFGGAIAARRGALLCAGSPSRRFGERVSSTNECARCQRRWWFIVCRRSRARASRVVCRADSRVIVREDGQKTS